jgi:hypothetical protein
MILTMPTYRNATVEEAMVAHCDIIQAKYPGIEALAACRNGQVKYTVGIDLTLPPGLCSELLDGEQFVGTYVTGYAAVQAPAIAGMFFVYDVAKDTKYVDRFLYVRNLFVSGYMPKGWELVKCYTIDKYPQVWQTLVEQGDANGVVFKQSMSLPGDDILVHRCVAKNGKVL